MMNNNEKFNPISRSMFLRRLWVRWRMEWNKQFMRQQAQQQALLECRIMDMMLEMTIDLYEALNTGSYPMLTSIQYPQTFRPHNYKLVDGAYFYQFRISKTSYDASISGVVLERMRSNMNVDIASALRRLIATFGMEQVQLMYPYLFYGLYVMNIRDLNDGDLIITVTSHIQP